MTTHLFTYGTLRPSGALDDLSPGRHIGTGILPGKLYRHPSARFPVLVDCDPAADADLVIGDVFAIDTRRSRQLDFIIDMECGAGYDARIREVTLSTPHPFHAREYPAGTTVPALVFTWPERFPVGPRIYSGDWFSAEAEDACADLGATAGFGPRRQH